MKIYLSALALLLFTTVTGFAQSDKNFRKKFDQADVLLNIDDNKGALAIFLDLLATDTTNANLNYKIGMCYFKSKTEKHNAIPYFEKAALGLSQNYIDFDSQERNAPYNALYLLAKSHHYNNQFAEAKQDYETYLDYLKTLKGDNKKEIKIIEREIERCKYGVEALKKPTRITVQNLGENINTIYPDYAPLISADESILIFTSRRKSMYNGNDAADAKYNDDVYVSYKENNEWQEAKPLGNVINTNENDATVGLSADGQQLFLYKEGDIYMSRLDGENWLAPVKLNENINTKAFEPSATISTDGNTIYFVSDRKGGFGGKDIYRSRRLPNGEWSLAQNLGPSINTEYDEDGPFISFDNRSIYFSSMGHSSIGGYDLFVSTLNDDNEWQTPQNLGIPINTTDDDVFFVTTPDEKHGYYSSAKEGNIGETDVYRITFDEKKETEVTVLAGKIINKDGGPLSSGIEIIVNDVLGKQTTQYYKPNTKTGKYIFSLQAGSTYEISYLIDGVEFDKEILDVPEGTGYQIINREIYLKSVAYGKEHTDKAKQLEAEAKNSAIDTSNAAIKVNGMSKTAMAMVNHIETKNTTETGLAQNNKGDQNTNNTNGNSSQNNSGTNNSTTQNNSSNSNTKTTTGSNTGSNNSKENTNNSSTTSNTTAGNNSSVAGSKTNTTASSANKIKAMHFLFAFNQSSLSELALKDLRKLAKIMKQNPSLNIEIQGHTDSSGSDKYNMALSARRAKSVKNYLVSLGVSAARIKTLGIGESGPIAINTDENGKPNRKGMNFNRRIDLKLSERQDEFIVPLNVPEELRIKKTIETTPEKTEETVKTKF